MGTRASQDVEHKHNILLYNENENRESKREFKKKLVTYLRHPYFSEDEMFSRGEVVF